MKKENEISPVFPSSDFLEYACYEIRSGLAFRYWIKLPSMWNKEKKWRKEFIGILNEKRQLMEILYERRET